MESNPKVFVVPELMPDEPVGEGALLQEHLVAERRRGSSSVRERLEAYLKDPGVARKPATQEWPKASELARMSAVERQLWSTWDAQHWLDAGLRKILNGKPAREVFKLETRKRTRPTTAARDRNMCAEVLRLMERCDFGRADAVARVAEVFGVSVSVVERATTLWGWDSQAKRERRRFVPLWEQQLRNAGKLK